MYFVPSCHQSLYLVAINLKAQVLAAATKGMCGRMLEGATTSLGEFNAWFGGVGWDREGSRRGLGLKLGGRRTEGRGRRRAERRARRGPSGGWGATCGAHGQKALVGGPARIQVPLSSSRPSGHNAARRQRRERRDAGRAVPTRSPPHTRLHTPTTAGVGLGMGGAGAPLKPALPQMPPAPAPGSPLARKACTQRAAAVTAGAARCLGPAPGCSHPLLACQLAGGARRCRIWLSPKATDGTSRRSAGAPPKGSGWHENATWGAMHAAGAMHRPQPPWTGMPAGSEGAADSCRVPDGLTGARASRRGRHREAVRASGSESGGTAVCSRAGDRGCGVELGVGSASPVTGGAAWHTAAGWSCAWPASEEPPSAYACTEQRRGVGWQATAGGQPHGSTCLTADRQTWLAPCELCQQLLWLRPPVPCLRRDSPRAQPTVRVQGCSSLARCRSCERHRMNAHCLVEGRA